MFLQTAKTELLDHIFKYWEKTSYKFVEVNDVKRNQYKHIPSKDKVLGTVKLRLSSKSVVYGRVADSIFSGLEATGGFYESMHHLGVLLVFFFQERLFKSSFMKQLYQVPSDIKPENKNINVQSMIKIVNNSESIDEKYINKILDYILLRIRFKYGYKEIGHYISNCMCLRKNHKTAIGQDKSHLFYEKGEKKLEKELDVVNLVRSIRQLRLMAQVLLGPNERMLLKFQRSNIVETTSSSSDSDHHSYDTVRLLNSKKDLIKLSQIVKIKKILK